MFSGNVFLFIFLVFLFIFILRYAYMRYFLRLQYRASLPRPAHRSPANTPNMAPYFIRLSAMQDARLQARRREVGNTKESVRMVHRNILDVVLDKIEGTLSLHKRF